MSINFAELLLILLPGFLGLWTFKRIVQENIDNREGSTQLALALMLGVSSLFCLFLVDYFATLAGFPILSIRAMLSPAAGKEQANMFFTSIHFWIAYGSLCTLAVFNGFVWAIRLKLKQVDIRRSICVQNTRK
jgi:hypothetical protein